VCDDRRVRRSGIAATALLAPAVLHIQFAAQHRFHGPPFDYVGLAAGAAVSWIGIPGPGEPLLLAAGILAAKHRLSLGSVLLVAWLAATTGGIVGWWIGLKAGRAVVTAPGPFRWLRIRTVTRGEEIFARHPVTAILMTPAFVAGINRVRSAVYQPVNVISAALWTVVIGVGGYFIGPAVLDWFGDLGAGLALVVVLVLVTIVGLEIVRRRRASGGTDPAA
jgi:membrane protein DedA with SNARE-associated domain